MRDRFSIAIITTLIGRIVMMGCSADEKIPFRALDREMIVEDILDIIPIGSGKELVFSRLNEAYGVDKADLEVTDYSEHPFGRKVNGKTVYMTEIIEGEIWRSKRRPRWGKPYAVWVFLEFSADEQLVHVRAQIHYGDSF